MPFIMGIRVNIKLNYGYNIYYNCDNSLGNKLGEYSLRALDDQTWSNLSGELKEPANPVAQNIMICFGILSSAQDVKLSM